MESLWNSPDKVDMIRFVSQWLAVISTIIALIFGMRYSTLKSNADDAKAKADSDNRILFERKIETANAELSDARSKITDLENKNKPRIISPDRMTVIQTELSKHRNESIVITCVNGDQEALAFASQLKTIFQSSGWTVRGLALMFSDVPQKGIIITIKDKSLEPKANFIFQLLKLAGFHSDGAINNKMGNDISLFIGSK